MKIPFSRAPVKMGTAVLAMLVAFLVVQDQRHGWPFSRHHNVDIATRAAVAHATRASSARSAAARVIVELPKQQLDTLGVQFEPVELKRIDNPVRAVATIVADESRITHVHARVAGWLEELYVNTTGQSVRAGEPLAGVFSQELYSSQQEYLSALRRAGAGHASAIVHAARTRLEVLGMDRSEIERLEKTGHATRLVAISAPRGGVVLNRGVSAGTAVDPSTEIVTIADLSHLWIIAEIAETDAAHVRTGSAAMLNFPMAYRAPFAAKVEFVYPMLTERTRTVRVRLPVPNKDGVLRPGMYGSAEFATETRESMTIARDAVIDTGLSQHVFVHKGGTVLEPRIVKLGARLADRVEVIEGLTLGEHVVTTGVFLIDSESRLRASGSTGHAGHGASSEAARSENRGEARDNDARGEHTQH